MTNLIKICIIAIILLGISISRLKAQSEAQKEIELKVLSIMEPDYNLGVMKDTVALLAINFKLTISKDKSGRARVTHIEANDTLGYKLFPSYKRLSTINFQGLMGADKTITFVVPFLVYNLAEYSKYAEYQDKNGNTLIEMRSAISAITALYSTMAYNNLKPGSPLKENSPIKNRIIYSQLWLVNFTKIH